MSNKENHNLVAPQKETFYEKSCFSDLPTWKKKTIFRWCQMNFYISEEGILTESLNLIQLSKIYTSSEHIRKQNRRRDI